MRPEILAPVGSVEALNAALAAGCDAVYFGLPSFGARAFANNFDLETTKEVIERCHLCGVKVYITMNTILYEDEIEDAYNMAAAYTGTENLLAVKDDYIEGGRVNMCKAIDDLILKGKLEGRVEGVRKEL